MLPESFLPSLIAELKTPNVIGITMAGSFSRGQSTQYSDVDLQLYVYEKPAKKIEYRLRQGHLVSLHYDRIEDERSKLTRPWDAIWAVPGLRQMVILYNKDASIADLQQAAVEFNWSPLQPLADAFASGELAGYAEEIYKILSGLSQNLESKVLYATCGLLLGAAKIIAVQHGTMIETENRYFDLVQESAGKDSEWTRLFRLALGADVDGSETLPYKTRGVSALALYSQTVDLMEKIVRAEDRDVIISTLKLIKDAGY